MKSGHYDEARLILKESTFLLFPFLLCIVYRMYPYNISVVSDLCLVEERAVSLPFLLQYLPLPLPYDYDYDYD